MNAPKRIWVDVTPDEFYQTWTAEESNMIDTDVEYVRADLAKEMRRAMVAYMERFPSVFGAPYRVVDDYKKAIKLLEEE